MDSHLNLDKEKENKQSEVLSARGGFWIHKHRPASLSATRLSLQLNTGHGFTYSIPSIQPEKCVSFAHKLIRLPSIALLFFYLHFSE